MTRPMKHFKLVTWCAWQLAYYEVISTESAPYTVSKITDKPEYLQLLVKFNHRIIMTLLIQK